MKTRNVTVRQGKFLPTAGILKCWRCGVEVARWDEVDGWQRDEAKLPAACRIVCECNATTTLPKRVR